MSSRLILSKAVLAGMVFALLSTPAPAQDAAPQKLQEAIRLHEMRDYEAAERTLHAVDIDRLSETDRQRWVQYVELNRRAVEGYRQALADLDDARSAIGRSDYILAKNLLGQVLQNDFAPEDVKSDVRSELSQIAQMEKRQVAPPRPAPRPSPRTAPEPVKIIPAQPVPAPGAAPRRTPVPRVDELIRLGQQAMDRGNYETAHQYFRQALDLVPGHPDAVSGLEQVSLHRRVEAAGEAPSEIRLIDRMRQRRAILWQRAVAAFRQAERDINEYLSANRFREAKQSLQFARETLESAKQYAEPLAVYEGLYAEYEALADIVEAREREYNERRAFEIRQDLEQQERSRQDELEQERQRQIDLLMEQVQQKKEDRDFEGAVQVLRQIQVIDPMNVQAEWLLEQLEDISSVRRQSRAQELLNRETRELLIQAEEAKVPWHKELNYPDNWHEINRSPYRQVPGEYPLEGTDEDFEQSFRARIPEISFNQVGADKALQQLAEVGGINIVPNWPDLAVSGVTRDTPVSMRLRDVALQTVLQEVIEQLEGHSSSKLGHAVRDGGIVKVATEDFLNREVFTRVYYVNDLIHPAEDFTDAPDFDLRKRDGRPTPEAPDAVFASRRTLTDEAPELERERSKRVDDLLALIRGHVLPGSWRDQGGVHATMHARSDGNLVVTQTARGHQEIFNLLNQLREDKAVQISIEARFLTVNHNWLEDMGIDLNIVLNNGNAGFDQSFIGGNAAFDPASGGRLLLPRNFSRLGFVPSTPGFGTTLGNQSTPDQSFLHPSFVPRPDGNGNFFSPVPINTNLRQYTDPGQLTSDVPGSFAGRDLSPILQIAGSFLDNIQVDFLIRATQADQRTSTLIAPKLIMTNGQQAWIAITEQQNFVSELDPQVASGAAAQRPIISTLDTGAVLNVQAVVSPDRRYVTMNLQPGVGRLVAVNTFQFSGGPVTGVGAPGFVQLPIIQRQNVKTTVTVPDGGTLLIGGQKLTFETEIDAGVPVLSKIPILKRLYSDRTVVKDEQVLLILIKPQILITEEQEEAAFPTLGSTQ